MKTQKLFVIAAIVCLLVGVSGGAAMAEGCADGVIYNETIDGTLSVTDVESCVIIGSTIEGNLRLIDVPTVVLLNNKVGGNIRVDGNAEPSASANVIANTVFGGRLVVRDYPTANVIENETLAGDIRVNHNVDALVQKNIAKRGLICNWNTTLDAFFNFAGDTLSCGN